jgi:hypothetical protein
MKFLDVPQSGSHDGKTHSRNRYGQYVRNRATPVNPNSTQQGVTRARLALYAANWRTLTDAQRAGWRTLGLSMSRTDSLGQTYTLTGLQAFTSVNSLKAAAGDAAVNDAPALVTPEALLSVTPTLTAIAFSIAYTATPLAANTRAFIFVSPQRSAGRAFESDFRLLAVTAAAAASPHNALAAYTAKFGVPVVGNRIFLKIHLYRGGFLGGPFDTSAVVA